MRARVPPFLLAAALLLGAMPVAAVAETEGLEASEAPAWAREASIYHVFTDRFADGDPSNNYDVDTSLDFSEALRNWMGGDIAGVRQRLDHIDELGFNTIWLGPVNENAYFHGYHAIDFVEVDPNFGTNAELKALVDEVHARDMRIIYDLVPNHTSDQHPFFRDAVEHCQESDYYEWYTFNADCTSYNTFFGLAELPQLDLDNPETRAYMLDVVVPFYLIELGFDGFRLDYVHGPSLDFWAAFRDAVDDLGAEKYTFGEATGNRNSIVRYQDVFDGAINFPLASSLRNTLAGNSNLSQLNNAVHSDYATYDDDFVLTSFLDNHDQRRFVHLAGNNAAARERLKVAFTAQFTLPYSPIVYYGTEVGMGQTANTQAPGGGWVDRWYREPMPWPDAQWAHADSDGFVAQSWHQDVADLVRDLNALRRDEPTLVHGDYITRQVESTLLVYERTMANDRILVVVNRGGERTIELSTLYGEAIPDGVTVQPLLGGEPVSSLGGSLAIDVPGMHGAVYGISQQPVTGDDCKNGGWQEFVRPSYENQGLCVASVVSRSRSSR